MVAGMIMGASASSVWYNLRVPHPTKEVPILDYDLALLFQPMLMLGITIGVALSVVFPYWLITVLIIILFLGQLKITQVLFIFIPLSYSFVERKKFFNARYYMFLLTDLSLSVSFVYNFHDYVGTSSRSFCKAIEMWKEETIFKVGFYEL